MPEVERISEADAIEAWHFLPEDRRLHGCGNAPKRTPVEAGQTLSVDPPLEICRRGLHASERAIDALRYAPGPIVCRVILWGDVIRQRDKLCAQYRRVLWMADATHVFHRFACDVATEALDAVESDGGSVDARSRKAIEVKLAWLRGEVTDEELAAARDAAWAAARDAAWAAAWDAARSAARAAARAKQNRRLADMLMSLKPSDED